MAPVRDRPIAAGAGIVVGMAQVFALLLFLDVALVVIALADCLRADADAIRTAPWAAWLFAILLLPPLGAIAWFVKGRPVPPVPLRRRATFVAPDDNPAFLAAVSLAIRERRSEQ